MLNKLHSTIKKINLFDLYLLVFLTPLLINPWGLTFFEAPKFVYLRIFVSIAIFLITILFFINGKIKISYGRMSSILLGLWLLSLTISTVFSVAPPLSFWGDYSRLQGLLTHIFYAIHFLIIYHYVGTKKQQNKLLLFIFWVSVAIAAYGIFQKFGIYIFSQESNETFVGRVFSTLGQPNFLGQYLIFPIWISYYLFKNTKKLPTKIIYVVGLLLFLTTLGLTENRASILGVIVVFILYFIFSGKTTKKLKWISLITSIIALVAFIALVAPSTRSLQSRSLIWQNTAPIINQNVLIGSGPETLFLTFPQHYPPELTNYENINGIPDRAHNEPLDTLIHQGLFGLIIYLSVLSAILIAVLRNKKLLTNSHFKIPLYALIATLISNLFSFQVTSHYLLFFTILAILAVNLEKTKTIKIKVSIPGVILAGLIFALLSLNIWNSSMFIVADTVFGKGVDQMIENKNADALKSFIYANDYNPHQGHLAFMTGYFFSNLGYQSSSPELYTTASQYYYKSYEFYGPNYEFFLENAVLHHYRKEYEIADQSFKSAQQIAPNIAAVYQKWGASLYERGEYQQTIETIEKYLSLIPEYWKWLPDLESKNTQEMETYRIFIKTTPGIYSSLEKLADSHEQAGNTEKAQYYRSLVPAN